MWTWIRILECVCVFLRVHVCAVKPYLCPSSWATVKANGRPVSSLMLQLRCGWHIPATWDRPRVSQGTLMAAQMSFLWNVKVQCWTDIDWNTGQRQRRHIGDLKCSVDRGGGKQKERNGVTPHLLQNVHSSCVLLILILILANNKANLYDPVLSLPYLTS